MGVRDRAIAGGVLLAVCSLGSGGGAWAMDLTQPGDSTTYSAPAVPSFLGAEHLPALEEAWRTREETSEAPAEPPASAAAPSLDPIAAARAAMEKVRQAGREDARQRAEELSRRFGAGSDTPAAEKKTSSTGINPPEAAASGQENKEGQAHLQVPEPPARKIPAQKDKALTTGALSEPEEVQPLDASVRTQSATTTQKLRLAAPMPPGDALPPLPRRAPQVRRSDAVRSTVSRVRARPGRSADPEAALRGTVLTNELHAFGWNSQPK